jgi:hypothetical protein
MGIPPVGCIALVWPRTSVAAGTQPLDLRVDDGDAVVILVRDMPHLPLGSYNPPERSHGWPSIMNCVVVSDCHQNEFYIFGKFDFDSGARR